MSLSGLVLGELRSSQVAGAGVGLRVELSDGADAREISVSDVSPGSSASQKEGEGVLGPAEEVRKLLGMGVSLAEAVALVSSYYRVLVSDGSVVSTGVGSVSSSSSRRNGRKKATRDKLRAMADVDGFCYLRAVPYAKRVAVSSRLGLWPDFMGILSLGPDELSAKALSTLAFVEVAKGRYHVETVPPGYRGRTAATVLNTTLEKYFFLQSGMRGELAGAGVVGSPLAVTDRFGGSPEGLKEGPGYGKPFGKEFPMELYKCAEDVPEELPVLCADHFEASFAANSGRECVYASVAQVLGRVSRCVVAARGAWAYTVHSGYGKASEYGLSEVRGMLAELRDGGVEVVGFYSPFPGGPLGFGAVAAGLDVTGTGEAGVGEASLPLALARCCTWPLTEKGSFQGLWDASLQYGALSEELAPVLSLDVARDKVKGPRPVAQVFPCGDLVVMLRMEVYTGDTVGSVSVLPVERCGQYMYSGETRYAWALSLADLDEAGWYSVDPEDGEPDPFIGECGVSEFQYGVDGERKVYLTQYEYPHLYFRWCGTVPGPAERAQVWFSWFSYWFQLGGRPWGPDDFGEVEWGSSSDAVSTGED